MARPYHYPLDRTNERQYADDFRGPIYVWDIDKTYLQSEINSLRGLLAIPLEAAVDKRNVAGTAALLRALRRGPIEGGLTHSNPIYFVSASPPQLRRVLQRKMLIDGVEFDGITFKDQVALVKKGQFSKLTEQMGYKLSALLLNRRELPWDVCESLFGDDSESDALIYCLYGDIVAGRLRGDRLIRTLRKNEVRKKDARFVADIADGLDKRELVQTIYINLENRSDPSRFAAFSDSVIPCWDTFQMALCLYETGEITLSGVMEVGHTLIEQYHRTAPSLVRSMTDLVDRHHIGLNTVLRLWDRLLEEELVPNYLRIDAERLAAHPQPVRGPGAEPGREWFTPGHRLA